MKTEKFKMILVMQVMNIVFSLNSVLIKLASISWQDNGLFAVKTVFLLGVAIGSLGIYAVVWQVILSKVDLAVAYLNKGTVVFWGLIWAFLFFKERISLLNIVGCVIIFTGLILVNSHE